MGGRDDDSAKETEKGHAYLVWHFVMDQEGGITPAGTERRYTPAVEAERYMAGYRPPAEQQTAEIRWALGWRALRYPQRAIEPKHLNIEPRAASAGVVIHRELQARM